MRDGNALTEAHKRNRRIGFWTSYEGWKPANTLATRSASSGFWTSYEGWKHTTAILDQGRQDSFWTSYEGWKLLCLERAYKTQKRFLNFLWGMETYCLVDWYMRLCLVFELPMRDGNFVSQYCQAKTDKGFWTSYEGWKLKAQDVRSPISIEFLNFLWGMETCRL